MAETGFPVCVVRHPVGSAMPFLGLSPGGGLLVVCAHPDDELAVSATLREAVRRGHRVHLFFATSGENSSSGATGPAREAESTQAMANLDIGASRLHFERLPDGGVLENLPQLVASLRRWTIRLKPQTLLTLAFEGGHMDHDSVHAAAFVARRGTSTTLWEFPTYHLEAMMPRALRFSPFGPSGGVLQHVVAPDHKALYDRQKHAYPSQIKGLENLETAADVTGLLRRGESVRLVPRNRDFFTAPGTRPLGYEVMAFPRRRWYGDFRHAVKALDRRV